MPRVLTIDRLSEWKGEEGQYETYYIDGVVTVIYEGDKEIYVPFRAEDKGGKTDEKPFIWLWENPQDPINDATLHPSIRRKYGPYSDKSGEIFHGKVVNGGWVDNG